MTQIHKFHIPIMGIGFTLDTPLKVSRFGIDSVISLVDDILLEKIRKMYSDKLELPYQEISHKIDDFRAKRITSYLNMINSEAEKKFEDMKNSFHEKSSELKEYLKMLPDSSTLKNELAEKVANFNISDLKSWMNKNLSMGSIDVNIMTKVDRDNYRNGEKLPVEYNDAHAALRGYALSDLESSVVLSAGMNPRLYNYMEGFDDFYPNEEGAIKKKVILKVSDYRSALIQGKYLAKKGIWVSEYRIESGLNCGGHAFATDGYLLGPVLEEFKAKRKELYEAVNTLFVSALTQKNKTIPSKEIPIKITAQGGVGTSEEQQFLLDHYEVDSVGWGTPFMLVPEATSVDEETMQQLMDAEEKDLYLSNISPLGVPFNSLRGNTKDLEKYALIQKGKPGSLCPKHHVKLNYEFTDKGLCTASSAYQRLKIKELDAKDLIFDKYQKEYEKIVEKSCVCVGLGTSTLKFHNIETEVEGPGVSVCPGPNLAYFSKKMKLQEMVDHIYGRTNVILRDDRPNMFVKELNIYIDFLKNKMDEAQDSINKKQEKYLVNFAANLKDGVHYYQKVFGNVKERFEDTKLTVLKDLEKSKTNLLHLQNDIQELILKHAQKKLNLEKVVA
ncbi:MAG: hypothetical protein B7C24_05655 [Bacteroidetes bacterium 4572_77]|nr:MAG: hypothetical protein B7C24_05655 [Bacteroidetes bacterium 4572_77]